jgi:UTP--glucose-1-phosphate uridylyltransferase
VNRELITRAVIPVAGSGTRLLPATIEQPKEMLPIFAPSENGNIIVKPLVHLVFEQLYDAGIREFVFIIGRGKRVIEDHFTQDLDYTLRLNGQGKNHLAADLSAFYRRLDDSNLVWINQPKPLGFGDAVLRAKKTLGDEEFLVHAGDTYIVSAQNEHLHSLFEAFETKMPEVIFIVKQMTDVSQRGVMEGHELSLGFYEVGAVVEKPEYAVSNLAIEPVYLFHPSIFDALEKARPCKSGELHLTDGIQMIIESGKKVIAWRLYDESLRFDIGDPEGYWEALRLSHQHALTRTAKTVVQVQRNT